MQRIIRNNPDHLRNPDYDEKSNTNLHLAAKHGFTQIAVRRARSCYVISSRSSRLRLVPSTHEHSTHVDRC